MEVERNSSLPVIGVALLNLAPRIETKVYVKPTNMGLLLHYQSHVDTRYKRSLITTMLDRAHRTLSDWSYFAQERNRLQVVFLKLKYPKHLFNLAVGFLPVWLDWQKPQHKTDWTQTSYIINWQTKTMTGTLLSA